MNERVRAFLMFPPAMVALGALIAAPQIVHVLDTGSTVATVEEIAAGKLSSRHVTVTAFGLPMRGLRQTVTEKKKEGNPTVSFFMPIADRNGEQGPTQVVVLSFRNEVTDAAEHPDRPLQFEGVVRDVLWEGLGSAVKRDLAAVHPLAPNAKLLELNAGGNFGDSLWAWGAPLAGLLFGLLAASNTKPKKPEAAR